MVGFTLVSRFYCYLRRPRRSPDPPFPPDEAPRPRPSGHAGEINGRGGYIKKRRAGAPRGRAWNRAFGRRHMTLQFVHGCSTQGSIKRKK